MAKEKTPEEKAAWAAKMKAAREAKAAEKAEAEKAEAVKADLEKLRETKIEEKENSEVESLKAMVMALQQQLAAQQTPKVVQVMADVEKITMLWQAEVADDNVADFGANGMYGQVTGKTGTVIVPKSEWSRFYNETNRYFLDNRWLIVLSGMTDEERRLYRCAYKPGEILDRGAFEELLNIPEAELLEIFPNLCASHQEMVAARFLTAYTEGKIGAERRATIEKLNTMSKKTFEWMGEKNPYTKGMFSPILEGMNEASVR